MVGLICVILASSSARTSQNSRFYLDRVFTDRVRVSYVKTITCGDAKSGEVRILAPIPPDIETQKLRSFSIKSLDNVTTEIPLIGDNNDRSRKYFGLKFDLSEELAQRPLRFQITYVLDLYKSQISRGKGKTPSASPDPDSLKSTPTIDFTAKGFQNYLQQRQLTKNASESNLDFAYRAFTSLSADLARRTVDTSPQEPVSNWKASYLVTPQCKDGGCGMCAIQLVAILRANGIASRLEAGRWALDDVPGYGQFHVRTSFYDPALGWVPVDPTFGKLAVRKGQSPDQHFGGTDGNFVTMHLNTDVSPVDTPFGMPIHQFEVVSYKGPGPFQPKITETWKVSPIR